MARAITTLFFSLITIQSIVGQTGQLISSTNKPSVRLSVQTTEINSIKIYEQVTVVSISFTSYEDNLSLFISSKSTICDFYNESDKLPIIGVKNDELDKLYNLGKKGEITNIELLFPRIPPGVEKINIDLPFENGTLVWFLVSINNPDTHPKTNWNEESLKIDWEKNGISSIEGIYESTTDSKEAPKYKVAVKKTENNYSIIYISGAAFRHWEVGEIKAYLYDTATPSLFKTKWFLGNKSPTENVYITFESGLMKLISTDKNAPELQQLYLKLYPTYNSIGAISSGTGFALTSNGLIVTCNHVIEGANKINVRGINGNFDELYSAKLIKSDKNNDLAIIQVDNTKFNTLGNIPYMIKSNPASTGENVFVLGYPLRASMGNEIKLTNGIVSSKTGYQGDVTSYQISAPVQPGNSGGPTFNNDGNLIGIINAKHSGAENVSYAVKVNYLLNLIASLEPKPKTQSVSSLKGKTLSQQVELVKKYVYIIETK